MKRALILLALLQTTFCYKSHYRVYGVLYCPLKKEWSWTANLLEIDFGKKTDLNSNKGSGAAQLQTYYMEGDYDDGPQDNYAEFEMVIRHTCHSDGKQRKLEGFDGLIDLHNGDAYFFKANHLGEHSGEIA